MIEEDHKADCSPVTDVFTSCVEVIFIVKLSVKMSSAQIRLFKCQFVRTVFRIVIIQKIFSNQGKLVAVVESLVILNFY